MTRKAIDAALSSMIGLDRRFVREANLNRERAVRRKVPAAESDEAVAHSLGLAIAALTKQGTTPPNLSAIYCADCDFSGLNLTKTDFSDAILTRANFSRAVVTSASFDGADLDSANFADAAAQGAKFSLSKGTGKYNQSVFLLQTWDRLPAGEVYSINGPDFSCADLRGADFSGRVLFGSAYQGVGFNMTFIGSSFHRSNIDRTDFSAISLLYGSSTDDHKDAFDGFLGNYQGGAFSVHGNGYINLLKLGPELIIYDEKRADQYFKVIGHGFLQSNWEKSILPKGLKEWLSKHPPEADKDPFLEARKAEITCQPTAPDQIVSAKMAQ